MTGRRATALGSMLLIMSSASSCALLYDFEGDDGQGARGGAGAVTGATATATTGTGMLVQGAACAGAAECASGFCVDGVCCDAACDTACVACAARFTDATDGTCAAVRAGTDPHDTCAQTACRTGACRGGACEPVQDTAFCGDPSCMEGVKTLAPRCLDGACTDQGMTPCASGMCAPGNDLCSEDCMGPDDCEPTEFCSVDGDCILKLPDGAECVTADECQNKNCFSRGGRSVCCAQQCGDACTSCLVADTGVADGACAPVRADEDPKDACPISTDVCGTTGGCDGMGSCAVTARGKPCGNPASCNGNTHHEGDACNGAGICAPGAAVACAPFACDPGTMTCKTTCASQLDCDAGMFCNQPSSQCEPLRGLGAACDGDGECASGTCAPGPGYRVCCTASCSGICEQCDIAGNCGFAPDSTPCGIADVCCGGVCMLNQLCGGGV